MRLPSLALSLAFAATSVPVTGFMTDAFGDPVDGTRVVTFDVLAVTPTAPRHSCSCRVHELIAQIVDLQLHHQELLLHRFCRVSGRTFVG